MDNQDIRTLKILEEIDNDHAPSQRDIAVKLNISLGLVNSFIKRLANKGYFKVTSVPKNRVKYILTHKGAAEKARLTYEYIQYSYRFYKKVRGKLKDILKDIEAKGNRNIVFYGAGDFAEIAYISLQETALELVSVFDDKNEGDNFLGKKIETLHNPSTTDFDKLIITKIGAKEDLIQEITEKGVDREKIVFVDWK
ncbi:MAG: winged helix-turn-helix transcriptional regulator [Deltaproteobacteria bacterium]|nr:winged helix-turn-helix transcriptional regulator [Deltaproteobacteria bacterium]